VVKKESVAKSLLTSVKKEVDKIVTKRKNKIDA
jgi:hypothetical protein